MFEIDQVLFFDKVIPKFDIRNMKRKQSDHKLMNFMLKAPVNQDWNSHTRVISFLFPLIKEKSKFHQTIKMTVPETDTLYNFHIGKSIPSFVFVPSKYEIY
jgi:hypothetical protein